MLRQNWPRHAAPLADRERHRFQRVEAGKQRVDLEGARQPAPHPLLRRQRGDVLVAEENLRRHWARSMPVIRLISVVLPAPFGPISA